MNVLYAKFDSKEINRILGNTVSYSYGFLDGIDMDQIWFNQKLGEFTVDAFGKYMDSRARVNPQAFHHIYEWNQVGKESGRLFELKAKASKRIINFNGKFLASKTTSNTSTEPFRNKANVMENAIAITIAPKNSDVLVFEYEGETVFTMNSIHIENPGGDEVAGSFGKATEDFFSNYFTNALLRPFIKELEIPKEFAQSFSSGTRSGKSAGVKAGKRYIRSAGMVIE
jgi:hypothetical protein